MTTKRASYKEATAWVAMNDDSGVEYALDPAEIQHQVTVVMVADLWGKDPLKVAADVIRVRRRLQTLVETKGYSAAVKAYGQLTERPDLDVGV